MNNSKRDTRFYITLIMGFILLVMGLFIPPMGIIDPSVLYGAGMLFILAAIIIGADIPAILKEIRLLKTGIIHDIAEDDKTKNEENSSTN